MSSANWYDLLDVEPTATADEIRTAWRSAVADLDPTDRRFRVYNQAAEVLLDPVRRAAYDEELAAELAAAQMEDLDDAPDSGESAATSPEAEPAVAGAIAGPEPSAIRRLGGGLPVVPGWVLVVVAALLAGALTVAGILLARPSDSSVENDTEAAQSAAERAIVPLLSYDAHHLDQSAAAAQPYMTSGEKEQYDKLFAVIRQNAPRTGTVVRAKYLASGVVRSGTDRVDVFVLVNQVTTNKQNPKVPVVYKNQVTVSMSKVGSEWLVDGLTTNGDRT
jgi:Mce-associated membrane protein